MNNVIQSEAMRFFMMTWNTIEKSPSWEIFNRCCQQTLEIAIKLKMNFGVLDCSWLMMKTRGCDFEHLYSLSCVATETRGRSNGENRSFCESFEKATGRKPFYIKEKKKKRRLALGSAFEREGHIWTVSSINDKKDFLSAFQTLSTVKKRRRFTREELISIDI